MYSLKYFYIFRNNICSLINITNNKVCPNKIIIAWICLHNTYCRETQYHTQYKIKRDGRKTPFKRVTFFFGSKIYVIIRKAVLRQSSQKMRCIKRKALPFVHCGSTFFETGKVRKNILKRVAYRLLFLCLKF